MKADDLRHMSDEQLDLTLKETERLFTAGQSATDRLETPSGIRRRARVARIKTIMLERHEAFAPSRQQPYEDW